MDRQRITYRRRVVSTGCVVGAVMLGIASPAAAHPVPACVTGCVTAVVEQDAVGDGPFGVAPGRRGGEWFSLGDQLGHIDRLGRTTTYDLPTPDANAGWVTRDPSRGIWVAERGTGQVALLQRDGAFREYPLPDQSDSVPQAIVPAPNGLIYITDQGTNAIVSLNPRTGAATSYAVPTPDATPLGMTLGPDRALWFTERSVDKVARMTLHGHFTEWNLTPGAFPNRITVGPDGALWFTELDTNQLGRITTTGTLTELPLDGGPVGITTGRDGQLYVVLFSAGQLARVNTSGVQTGSWTLPAASFALQVARGQHDDLWATDSAGLLYRVTPYAFPQHRRN
jgi:virginiamycin B lyase